MLTQRKSKQHNGDYKMGNKITFFRTSTRLLPVYRLLVVHIYAWFFPRLSFLEHSRLK